MLDYFKIKSIRKFLTKEATEILVLSVISDLDYCNVILYGITQEELGKLQCIQNNYVWQTIDLTVQNKHYMIYTGYQSGQE